MGGRGASSRGIGSSLLNDANNKSILSLDEYLGYKGLNSIVSDFMLDKTRIPHGQTERQKKQLAKESKKASDDYHNRRNKAIEDYNKKVASGELKMPSSIVKHFKTAQGHDDNASVQASRRILTKKGYDWKTGKKIK